MSLLRSRFRACSPYLRVQMQYTMLCRRSSLFRAQRLCPQAFADFTWHLEPLQYCHLLSRKSWATVVAAMLNKLINGQNKTWRTRGFRSIPLNRRKQSVGLHSKRDEVTATFKSQLTLLIFKSVEQRYSASFTELRA